MQSIILYQCKHVVLSKKSIIDSCKKHFHIKANEIFFIKTMKSTTLEYREPLRTHDIVALVKLDFLRRIADRAIIPFIRDLRCLLPQ